MAALAPDPWVPMLAALALAAGQWINVDKVPLEGRPVVRASLAALFAWAVVPFLFPLPTEVTTLGFLFAATALVVTFVGAAGDGEGASATAA